MRIPNAYYLIIDLESTCTNENAFPRDEMEIIEIGALTQDARTFEVVSEFQSFIRPIRHPVLTRFCRELTTITQAQVEDGPPFAEVMGGLVDWVSDYDDAVFCSWGAYDRKQFSQDCQYHGVAYPFGGDHVNLKAAFSEAMKTQKRFGIGGAIRKLGLTFEGTAHRGIDDVRNIARIVEGVCMAV